MSAAPTEESAASTTDSANAPRTVRHELRIPARTIVGLLVAAAMVWALLKLGPEIVLVIGAVLLSTALAPLIDWAEARRIPRAASVATLGVLAVGGAGLFVVLALPAVIDQIAALASDLPRIHDQVVERLNPSPMVRDAIDRVFDLPSSVEVKGLFKQPIAIGVTALSGVTSAVLTVVVTFYLLIDGKRVYAWFLAYVPRRHRPRVAATMPELAGVIRSYLRGQLTISFLFAVFVAIVGVALKLPAVVPLALLAFVCDIVPVVGIFIATAPAAALALVQSPTKAIVVIVAFFGYHLIETYLIAPKLYGSRMRINAIGVLLGLLCGGALFGLFGAIISLPVVAAYPIIERIWLKDWLAPDVIREHAALDLAEGPRSDATVRQIVERQERGVSSLPLPLPMGNERC